MKPILALIRMATWLYLVLLAGWALLAWLVPDRWWWLFVLTSLAPYLFVPLPLLLLVACLTRWRDAWLGFALAALLGVATFGWALLPPATAVTAHGPALTVLSFNLLGSNRQTAQALDVIRESQADLVALQELNPAVAAALQRELGREYPYQVLAPLSGVQGMGVISRYPLRAVDASLPGVWVGTPQVLELDFNGTAVTVVNFHAIPPMATLGLPANEGFTQAVREREAQMRALAALVVARPGPLLAMGDLNATDRNSAHRIISAVLHDAWAEAGSGLGHTWPGRTEYLRGIPLPQRLVRIDYVLHSPAWQATSIQVGATSAGSDHLPVVARLHAITWLPTH